MAKKKKKASTRKASKVSTRKASKLKLAETAKPRKAKRTELAEQDITFEALLNELLPRQRDFIEAFYETSTIAAAASSIGCTRQAHHDVWMAKNETGEYAYPLYAQIFHSARSALIEIAESALWKRGVKGVIEPVFWRGKKTDHTLTKFDTTALIFWLKGNCPEKYKERFEHTGRDGGPMTLTIDAARQKIAENFDKNKALTEGE